MAPVDDRTRYLPQRIDPSAQLRKGAISGQEAAVIEVVQRDLRAALHLDRLVACRLGAQRLHVVFPTHHRQRSCGRCCRCCYVGGWRGARLVTCGRGRTSWWVGALRCWVHDERMERCDVRKRFTWVSGLCDRARGHEDR